MENIHIRLEHETALEGKKQLLSSEITMLELLKILKRYKTLRKKELVLKEKLKKELNNLKKDLSEIKEFFPAKAAEFDLDKEHVEKVEKKTEEERDIESQLKDIQDKLAKLK